MNEVYFGTEHQMIYTDLGPETIEVAGYLGTKHGSLTLNYELGTVVFNRSYKNWNMSDAQEESLQRKIEELRKSMQSIEDTIHD